MLIFVNVLFNPHPVQCVHVAHKHSM